MNRQPLIDWFVILADLRNAGISTSAVGRDIDVPESTLRGWAEGHCPNYEDGRALIEYHAETTGNVTPQVSDHYRRNGYRVMQ